VLDLTERKRAEVALRESEEQWKAVFENNPTMYFMVDTTGTIISVNPFGAEQLGYRVDELIGRPVQMLFPEADRDYALRNKAFCLEHLGQTMSWELRKLRKDGEALWFRETARAMLIKNRPVVLVVSEDITEVKRAAEALREVQAELAHANRVATMGQLTASIAHEVNQPIATARNNAGAALRFLNRNPPDLEEVRQALECIVSDTDRAGDVISRIRSLIKKAPPRTESFDMNEAIRNVIVLTHHETVKEGISVETQLAEGLPLIQGDRVQMQQVLLNLIINAIEAMSTADEGARELLIRTAKSPSDTVLVGVEDSGPGLDPANTERAFEAFYTTKAGGLGLGLSICQSIIEAHGGRFWASANVPRGAIFQFTVRAHADSSS
jgi:PAS domain S-box-containing protein